MVSHEAMRPDRAIVKKALADTNGNKSQAAALLGCSRQTLYNWIYLFGLERYAGVSLDRRRELDTVGRQDTRRGAAKTENKSGHESHLSNRATEDGVTLRLVQQQAATVSDFPVQATLRIRDSLWKQMKIEAIRRGVTVAALAEAFFERGLADAETPRKSTRAEKK